MRRFRGFATHVGMIGIASAAAVGMSVTASADSSSSPSGFVVIATQPSSYLQVAHRYDAAGRLLESVKAPALGTSLTWSPDGRMVAVADDKGVSIERGDGRGRRRLLAIRDICSAICLSTPAVAWSPDDKTLAIGGVDPMDTGLVLVNLATGHARPIVKPHARVLYSPTGFSPNGKLLAYAVDDESGRATCACDSLVVSNADGTRRRTVVRFHDHHDGPGAATWSPDSSRIAFTDEGRDPRDPHIGVVNVRTGSLQSLDSGVAPNADNIYLQAPAWSPDGKSLALGRYHQAAFTIGEDGAGFQDLNARATAFAWLKDGDLLFSAETMPSRVGLLSPRGRAAKALFVLPNRETPLSLREIR